VGSGEVIWALVNWLVPVLVTLFVTGLERHVGVRRWRQNRRYSHELLELD